MLWPELLLCRLAIATAYMLMLLFILTYRSSCVSCMHGTNACRSLIVNMLAQLCNVFHTSHACCRGLDDAQFALLLTSKNAQRLLAIKDPGQCLN